MTTLQPTAKQDRREAFDLLRATTDHQRLELLLAVLPEPAIPYDLIDIEAAEPTLAALREEIAGILTTVDDEGLRAAHAILSGREYVSRRVVTHHLDGTPITDAELDAREARARQVINNGGGISHEDLKKELGVE